MFHVFRMGGALQAPPRLDSLPLIDASETVHDIPEIEPPSVDVPLPQPPDFLETLDARDRGWPYREMCLHLLWGLSKAAGNIPFAACPKVPIHMCCQPSGVSMPSPFEVSVTYRGTASILEWVSGCNQTILQTSSVSVLEKLKMVLWHLIMLSKFFIPTYY